MLHYFRYVNVPLWSSKEFSSTVVSFTSSTSMAHFFQCFPHQEATEKEKNKPLICWFLIPPQFCEHRRRDPSRDTVAEIIHKAFNSCFFGCYEQTQTAVSLLSFGQSPLFFSMLRSFRRGGSILQCVTCCWRTDGSLWHLALALRFC